MNYYEFDYKVSTHPATIAHWDKLLSARTVIPKVKKDFASDFTEWYKSLVSKATQKIHEWENIHQLNSNCKKGCPFCCNHPVLILNLEALAIYTYLNQNNMTEYIKKAKEASEEIIKKGLIQPRSMNKTIVDNFKNLYFQAQLTCPFLDDGSCVVYPVRPTNCISYFYYGNPEDCKASPMPQYSVTFNPIDQWMIMEINNFVQFNIKKAPRELLRQ